ncbi:MAG: 3-hydroxyacyl-ACP dehydratase FabZ [Terriglobia bacterium]|jgi:3-hydroxyacyl-[acyl-carrier-protein] dehydratase
MTLDINEIMKIIPHRYPFLLVDRIEELVSGERVVGLKNVTINEPFFAGHFPQAPVMPGVLILEAIAQVGAVLVLKDMPDRLNKLVYFVAIESAKFRRPVLPGDQLRIVVTVESMRSKFGKMRGEASVDGKLAAEAEVTYAVVDRETSPGKA